MANKKKQKEFVGPPRPSPKNDPTFVGPPRPPPKETKTISREAADAPFKTIKKVDLNQPAPKKKISKETAAESVKRISGGFGRAKPSSSKSNVLDQSNVRPASSKVTVTSSQSIVERFGLDEDLKLIQAGIGPYIASTSVTSFASKAISGISSSSTTIPGVLTATQTQTLLTGAPGFIVNVATKSIVQSFALRIVEQLKKPAVIAGVMVTTIVGSIMASLGGKVFNEFIREESAQSIGFVKSAAFNQALFNDGDFTLFDEAMAVENEVLADNDLWEEVKSFIPWVNAITAVDEFRKTALTSNTVWQRLRDNQEGFINNKVPVEEQIKIVQQQEKTDYTTSTSFYNEERKKMLIWETELKRQSQISSSERERKERIKQADFWANERGKQRKKEAEDRQAIADFWNAYKKQQQKISDNNRPSNLNFGLL